MGKIIEFAHLADLHLGGWREKKLTALNLITFKLAIKKIIDAKVDFVLFAGDIFNSPIPPIEIVEFVVAQLIKLKTLKIPLYVIGGSHDYSNTGKSFISLLETAELFIDVSKYETIGKNEINLKFFKDSSGANISGILGKKNGLDKNIYKNLNQQNLSKDNFNIFMFHCTLNDIKPDFLKNINSEITSNLLPKGFDYYCAGHVHTYIESNYDGGTLSYPGPLFPNNFRELIFETPSFNFCSYSFETKKVEIKREFLKTYEREYFIIEFNEILNPIEAYNFIIENIDFEKINGKIILLKIKGVIRGKITDIRINKIISKLYDLGAYVVLKNTLKLQSQNLDEIKIVNSENISKIENEIIEKILKKDNPNFKKEFELCKEILKLELNKFEEEKNFDYEQRIKLLIDKTII